jgi:hypothetical protein
LSDRGSTDRAHPFRLAPNDAGVVGAETSLVAEPRRKPGADVRTTDNGGNHGHFDLVAPGAADALDERGA